MNNLKHETQPQTSSAIEWVNPSHVRALPILSEKEFLPPISRWMRFGGIFVIFVAGLAIPLASKVNYKVAVKAQASVRPDGELRYVQTATPGTIQEIRIKENQEVKRGEIIAILDRSRLEAKQTQLEDSIRQGRLQLRQIQAQITAQDNRILAERDRSLRTIISANAELARNQRNYQNLQITTDAEVAEAQANLQVTAEELQQAQTDLITVTADWKSSQAELNAAISKRDRYQTIANSGAISQNQLEEAKLAVIQLQEHSGGKKAAIVRQQQEITRRERTLTASKARLLNVRAALDPSDAEVAIARSNIEREKAISQATIANLQKEKEALIQQNIEVQNQIARDTSELQQVAIDLEQTIIKATADGTIFQLNLRNTGQTLVAGDRIAQIAPSESALIVKALVSAKEIGKIEIGQTTRTKISACPYPDYGTLTGTVTKIAPDALSPQANGMQPATAQTTMQAQGNVFYEVTVKPDTETLQRDIHQCLLQTGMEGRADIITKEESVLQFMLRKAKLLTDI